MKFIIVGHGRSGTQYMAKLMQYFGYAVLHEKRGEDGISAMDAMQNTPTSRGWQISYCKETKRLLYSGDPSTKTIHVVRDPWKVVQSDYGKNAGVARGVAQWFPKINLLPGITRVIHSVVLINEEIEKLTVDLTLRVETAEPVMRHWLKANDLFIGTRGQSPSKTTGHKDHRYLDDGDWSSAQDGCHELLESHALRYGYQ